MTEKPQPESFIRSGLCHWRKDGWLQIIQIMLQTQCLHWLLPLTLKKKRDFLFLCITNKTDSTCTVWIFNINTPHSCHLQYFRPSLCLHSSSRSTIPPLHKNTFHLWHFCSFHSHLLVLLRAAPTTSQLAFLAKRTPPPIPCGDGGLGRLCLWFELFYKNREVCTHI